MAEILKPLAQAFAPTTTGVIYTVPALTETAIKLIHVVNTDASNQRKFTLYLNGTAILNTLVPETTLQKLGLFVEDALLTLKAGDTIQAKADLASTIAIILFGAEIT